MNFSFICSNIPAAPAYGVYVSQLIRYPSVCGSYQDFFDRGLLLARKLPNQEFLLVKLKSSLERFTVTTTGMTLFAPTEYQCHKWPLNASTSWSFPLSWLITEFASRVARRVPLVKQELLIPFRDTWVQWCSIFSFMCSVLHIVVCPFSFGHCVVCPAINEFWPLWYLQTFLRTNKLKKATELYQRWSEINIVVLSHNLWYCIVVKNGERVSMY